MWFPTSYLPMFHYCHYMSLNDTCIVKKWKYISKSQAQQFWFKQYIAIFCIGYSIDQKLYK